MKIFFILSIIFTLSVFNSNASVKSLKDKITSQSLQVNKLAAQIKDIDNKINSSNSEYVKKMKEIDKLDLKISRLKNGLEENASHISEEYHLAKLSFDNYLLESSDIDSEESILTKEIYIELLEQKIKKLKEAQLSSNQNLSLINELEQKITIMKKDEETLYNIIISLENNKKNYSQKYLNILENKNANQSRLDKLISKRKAVKKVFKNRNIPFKLELPLQNYVELKKSKEGINLKYSETTPILSPRAGKVVYAGELASYGNVVIVDHGSQVRSVLLGDIVTKVKKGDNLKDRQLIGYTVADLGTIKSLYFEVRKKDQAQNTVSWLNTDNIKL